MNRNQAGKRSDSLHSLVPRLGCFSPHKPEAMGAGRAAPCERHCVTIRPQIGPQTKNNTLYLPGALEFITHFHSLSTSIYPSSSQVRLALIVGPFTDEEVEVQKC